MPVNRRGYGLDESSDEDDVPIQIENGLDEDEAPPTQSLDLSDEMDYSIDNNSNIDNDNVNYDSEPLVETKPNNNFIPSLSVQPQRVQVMQTSFFHNDDNYDLVDNSKQADQKFTLPKLVQPLKSQDLSTKTPSPSSFDEKYDENDDNEHSFKPNIIRNFKRVKTNFNESYIHNDLGLSLGNSFKSNLTNFGQFINIDKGLPSIIKFHNVLDFNSDNNDSLIKLLELQFSFTQIDIDNDTKTPQATTNSDLRFNNFVNIFNNDDYSHEATYWRLGSCLFDEINLNISDVDDEKLNRILNLRRKLSLSNWLTSTLTNEIEIELKNSENNEPIDKIFTLLSGNQIKRAANLAVSIGDLRLATLISQLPGDGEYKTDLSLQIKKWKDNKCDSQIDRGYRKVYGLLAGLTDTLMGTDSIDSVEKCENIDISENLDWKRCFGLRLWYGSLFEDDIKVAIDNYDNSFKNFDKDVKPTAAYPSAWYLKDENNSSNNKPYDSLYSLIKLYVDPLYTLEKALEPVGFTNSRQDWRLPWHIYTILSRVLRIRDFNERFQVNNGDDSNEFVEGHSSRADSLAINYANQIEQLGLPQWSIFILLHLEIDSTRIKAIKESLNKNILKYSESDESFLINELHIPETWLYEAKALHSRYNGQKYDEYKLLLKSQLFNEAHIVAVNSLIPEAIIRDDMNLLENLLQPFINPDITVDHWSSCGKLLLDYSYILKKVPELIVNNSNELRDIFRKLPIMIQSIPHIFKFNDLDLSYDNNHNVQHMITLSEMTEKLLNIERILREYIFKQSQDSNNVNNEFIDPFYSTTSSSLLTQGAQINLLESESFSAFKTSLEAK